MTLLILSGAILKFLFEVWRKNDLSSVKCLSPRSFKFFSSLAQLFHSSFRCASIILGGASRFHSHHLKTKEVFSVNLVLFSSRFMLLVRGHPLIIVLIVKILFTYPEKFKSLLSLLSGVHQFRFIHSQLSVIILQSYQWIVQISSNQFMISSFFCI